ncbi:MAG: 2-hydroxyacyl-CoA dehydratase [Candidatus Abyssobacteria bacterium SURF_5]|uniref:2-hydroxyacyl-CoA dehydratase n=1 Tax=Abyssobacteria bacterium (strain SURF_5) TaxID=2093360 RepID=A0A3A4NMT4_ABYX5|nr:MAG: 2-hydroxyacyl-CoA dehydratase [Candidatus Abyssubacteria bacterium SURF_5]
MIRETTTETFFSEIIRNRADYLRDLKKRTAKKIFGYFCTYTPEELLYAAGIHPVRLFGGTEDITQADTLIQSFVCPFVRGVLDMALKGGFDYLDGIVHAYTCDATCGLFGIWQRNIKTDFAYMFSPPYFPSESSIGQMARELKKLAEALEEYSGRTITEDSLHKAIDAANRKRSVLKRLYSVRAANPSPIAGSKVLDVVLAGSLMPPEDFSDAVESLIGHIMRAAGCGQDPHRIYVSGSELHDPEILKVIEEAGAAIVGDDLCTGSRGFYDLVEPAQDPFEALARRYVGRIPCPSRLPVRRRLEYILEGMRESRAEALIFIIQKFCDPHLAEQPLLSGWLKEANGIPNMVIETEHRLGPGHGQLRTRIQSFLEMISQ